MSRDTTLSDDLAAWQRAAYELVHGYRGRGGKRGAEALAAAIGMAPRSLSNMVNPDVATAKLGVGDAIALMHAARDYRLLEAIAAHCDHLCWRLPDADDLVDDLELIGRLTAWQAAIGETMQQIHDTLEDRRVEPHEVRAVTELLHQQMRRGMEFVERLRQLQEPEAAGARP